MTPVIIIILKSTAVGKYARRPLNHAVQELSLKALARRIVLPAHIPAKKSNNAWTIQSACKVTS